MTALDRDRGVEPVWSHVLASLVIVPFRCTRLPAVTGRRVLAVQRDRRAHDGDLGLWAVGLLSGEVQTGQVRPANRDAFRRFLAGFDSA
jgi:hypothetical protein